MGEYKEYRGIALGDKTLSQRVERTLEQLSSDPTASISGACKDPHQAKAIYRLLSNDKFKTEAVIDVSRQETVTRIAASGAAIVLIPQDTTFINYSGLKNTDGLGVINENQESRGLVMHSAIAVGEDGEVFGLLSEKTWVRPVEEKGKKNKRKRLPIEEKESYKWLETLDTANITEELGNIRCIYLCDREGDLYELFAKAKLDGATYLCRRIQNRIIKGKSEEKFDINTYLNCLSPMGEIVVNVPRDSHTNREKRVARLKIKFGKALIKKPVYIKQSERVPETIEVVLISAEEIEPPSKKEAISWQLVTNDIVETFEDAVVCVNRYTQRWKIETFHYVLKSGCAIEKLQESTVEKLEKLIALYSIIALRIMALTFLARTNPDASCETVFEAAEWKILYKVVRKTKSIPMKPPTILEVVFMIAKLGGFLARRSDGFPGVAVIWRGLTSFDSILNAYPFLS